MVKEKYRCTTVGHHQRFRYNLNLNCIKMVLITNDVTNHTSELTSQSFIQIYFKFGESLFL